MSGRRWSRALSVIKGQVASLQARAHESAPLAAGAFLWVNSAAIRQIFAALEQDQRSWGEVIIEAVEGEGLAFPLHHLFGIGPEPCYDWTDATWWKWAFGEDQARTTALFRAELKRRPLWLKQHRAELRKWLPVVLAIVEVAEVNEAS